ncbi:MAG TPA: translation initiation factor [Phycisphaerales bacterium]|nr:translation initiation factor [Phycisphaerales bacterium]HCD32120.1 translation initiation factor [Phycisphaerales bacterium]
MRCDDSCFLHLFSRITCDSLCAKLSVMGLFDGTALERPVTCEVCDKALTDCTCPRDADGNVCLPKDQQVRVHREKRKGKWNTVITGLDPKANDFKAMLKKLKNTCSAGGAVKDDHIEIQGDHRDRLVKMLIEQGFKAKAAGG